MGVCITWLSAANLYQLINYIISCFQQHVEFSLDSMIVCNVWSLKSESSNLRKVELLQSSDTYTTDCMDCYKQAGFPVDNQKIQDKLKIVS